MVPPAVVQLGGQLPKLTGDPFPAEAQFGSLVIEGRAEGTDVEPSDGWVHHRLILFARP